MRRSDTARLDLSRRDALEQAFEEHYVPLVRLSFVLSGDSAVAEDLAQEAFVRSAVRIDSLPHNKVGAYLRSALVNIWRSRLRRLRLERLARGAQAPSPQSGLSYEERDLLWQAVLRLPARQRGCLVLRYYEGMTEAQVAGLLRCSVGTVKSNVARGLERLRRDVTKEEWQDED
jgi:RNA polymerase sigma-70 factor (sigma-E family)